MSEFTTVCCDGDDCYVHMNGCDSADAHEQDDGYDNNGFVTAFKRMPWSEAFPESSVSTDSWMKVDSWQTYCRDCATRINIQGLRDNGWEVKTPEGFVEGEVCPDCFHCSCPGRRDNGEKQWTGSGSTFKMNDKFKQWECETCDGEGWLKDQIADERKVRR